MTVHEAFVTGVLIGVFLGTLLGIFIVCLCVTASDAAEVGPAADTIAWPCFGGPLDGEHHTSSPFCGFSGHYAFCVARQCFVWREPARRS